MAAVCKCSIYLRDEYCVIPLHRAAANMQSAGKCDIPCVHDMWLNLTIHLLLTQFQISIAFFLFFLNWYNMYTALKVFTKIPVCTGESGSFVRCIAYNCSNLWKRKCTQEAHIFPISTSGTFQALPGEINQFDSLGPSGAYIICICVGVCALERSSRNQLVFGAEKRTSVDIMRLCE